MTLSLRAVAAVGAAALLLGACGDDDPADSPSETEAAAPTDVETDATEDPSDDTDPNAELCAVAVEIFETDDFPTADQLTRYRELAPDEIRADVETAADAFLAAEPGPVGFIAAAARDDVEDAMVVINAWESDNCGIDHEDEEPVPGTTEEVDPEANLVEVSATEFAFEVGEVVAGRNSFVLTADGAQAHHLLIFRLPEGMTAEEAVMSEEEDNGVEDVAFTDLAAPGGEDEEVVTADLEAGNYAFVCFLPAEDGTPHAFMGMAQDVTVA